MNAIEFIRVSTQGQGREDRAGPERQRESNKRTIERHSIKIFKFTHTAVNDPKPWR